MVNFRSCFALFLHPFIWVLVSSSHTNSSSSCIGGSQYLCSSENDTCPETRNATDAEWNYSDEGPATWWRNFPNCGSLRQSPVDLEMSSWRYMRRLRFRNYDQVPSEMVLLNNGHSLQVTAVGIEASLSGGPVSARYILDSLHFHWSDGPLGSEHYNGKSYALEIHFVHYNENYGNLTNAENRTDGLLVLGVFCDLSAQNSSLSPIVDGIQNVTTEGTNTTIAGFRLDSLFNTNNRYFTYQGSLTTPPCYESVDWIIMRDEYSVSCYELNQFRTLLRADGSTVSDNYRPIQPRNGRSIYKSI